MQLRHLDHPRAAAVLLPLAGGLAVAAVAQLSIPAVIVPVNVVVLVLLGAVLPQRPWRTAVLAEAPGLALALGRAMGESWMLVGLVIVVAPLFVAISAVLVKAGAALRRDRDERRAEGTGEVGRSTGDRGLFATEARRGAFLILLVTLLATCNRALTQRWGDEADRLARQRAEEIRTALSGRTPKSLQESLLSPFYGGAGEPLPGGPYREYRPGSEEFWASAEVRSGLEFRCIRVRVGADAVVHTEIEGDAC
jgi:hypothetical protein